MNPRWDDPQAEAAALSLGDGWGGAEVACVLGSGLGGAASGLDVRARARFADVAGLGSPSVPGHEGLLLRGTLAGAQALVFVGRRHVYEGLAPAAAAFPVRLAARLGARLLVTLCAVGAVDEDLPVGAWVFLDDHVNLLGRNPLEGVRTPAGPPFVDLSRAYRTDLFDAVGRDLAAEGVGVRRGVLACFPGPSYETPAEVRMARTLGAAVVGMSTVPEAVWARFLAMDVLAFGRVANPGAGLSELPIDHRDVLRSSEAGAGDGERVLRAAVGAWREAEPAGGRA